MTQARDAMSHAPYAVTVLALEQVDDAIQALEGVCDLLATSEEKRPLNLVRADNFCMLLNVLLTHLQAALARERAACRGIPQAEA